jgi:hypothetical protein
MPPESEVRPNNATVRVLVHNIKTLETQGGVHKQRHAA